MAPRPVNVPRSPSQLAAFEVTTTGRLWVTPEAKPSPAPGEDYFEVEAEWHEHVGKQICDHLQMHAKDLARLADSSCPEEGGGAGSDECPPYPETEQDAKNVASEMETVAWGYVNKLQILEDFDCDKEGGPKKDQGNVMNKSDVIKAFEDLAEDIQEAFLAENPGASPEDICPCDELRAALDAIKMPEAAPPGSGHGDAPSLLDLLFPGCDPGELNPDPPHEEG